MEKTDKIVCPLCDEPLCDSIDQIPDKCPVCDTRRYEILQEIRQDDQESESYPPGAKMGAVAVPSHSEESEAQTTGHTPQSQVVVVEESAEDVSGREDQSGLEEEVIFSENGKAAASVAGRERANSRKELESEDVIFDSPAEAAEEVSARAEERGVAPARPSGSLPARSGASSLEIFPVGFKYCPSCGKDFPRDLPETNCAECGIPLDSKEKGLPPGHYLVLYNTSNKGIAYFRLDGAGSIIIGRSSERHSPKDIDLTMAWKHYYRKHAEGAADLKQKMRMLKGISRKHVLIRYLPTESKYILFHLSEKNFTVVQMAGEKRVRPPQNRTRVDLTPGAIISIGSRQEFIVMRYQMIPPP